MTDHEQRNSREIESDMERTRSRIGESIHSLENKLSPGELMDEALHYFKNSGSNEFASNFGATIKQNPMPITLVGIGLGWLMVSGSSRNANRGVPASSTSHRGSAYPMTSSSSTSSRSSLDHARERTGAATDKAKDYAGSAQDRAKHAAGSAEAKAKDYMGRAQGKAEEWQDKAGEWTDSARDGMHRMQNSAHASSDRMSSNARRAQGQLRHIMHEQPLVVGALGLALGAALGAGLPSSDFEDEWMGEARDDVVNQAAETGQQQYEKAKDTAKAAAESAKDTAKHEAERKDLGRDTSTTTGKPISGQPSGTAIKSESKK